MRDTWLSRRFFMPTLENGTYPHPGLWLTDSDSIDDGRFHDLICAIDIHLVAPLFCRLGHHRWISHGEPGKKWVTKCWYCKTDHPKQSKGEK